MASRAAQLAQYWNYLPAFRVVAEHEHFGRGAADLGVTSPALSRAVRMLEESLGVELFTAHGRGVRLTKAGHDLLASVRDAMRLVDDGVGAAKGRGFRGALRVSCASSWAARVLGALMELANEREGLVPFVRDPADEDPVKALLQGDLDLVVTHAPAESAGIDSLEIAAQEFGVYCGATHPLFESEAPEARQLRGADFVVAAGVDDGTWTSWPAAWPREVIVRAGNLGVRLGVCMTRPLLAVLPDIAVRDHVAAGRLRKLPGPDLPSRELYAMRRRQLVDDDVVQLAVDSIAAALS